MKEKIISFLIIVLLIVFQIFVFNNIRFWGLGCVFIYFFYIIFAPITLKPVPLIIIGFFTGLVIDLLSNGYGVCAFAATLIAYLRPKILRLFFSENELEYKGSKMFFSLSYDYYKYVFLMIVIHNFVVFSLEAYSLKLIVPVLLKTTVSTVISAIFFFFIYALFANKKNER